MTPEEINTEIAVLCGWKRDKSFMGFYTPEGAWTLTPPNYHSDLNACAEMIKPFRYTDTGSTLWHRNNFFLSEIVSRDLGMSKDCVSFLWEVQNATAPQRCEAFLRTHNKWLEPPP